MKVTLKDVAEKAGVSTATASLALSGKGRISEAVRLSVFKAAEETGYNQRRKQLKQINTGSVVILISIDAEWSIVYWFIRPIITEIQQYYSQQNENVVLLPISKQMSDNEILQNIAAAECSAVFSLHYGSKYLLSTLENMGIPIVVIMNGKFQENFHCILSDDFQGAYEGTKHLIKLGHTKILYVETERTDLPVLSSDRFYGFMKALDEAQVQFNQKDKVSCDVHNTTYFEAVIHSIFSVESPPTAVFAFDDDVAIRVIHFLHKMGYRIPEDISILAPGDLLNYSDPHIFPITTLRINTQRMGQLACDMMNELRGATPDSTDLHVLKVKQQLVQRGSTRAISPKRIVTQDINLPRERFLSAFLHADYSDGIPKWLGASREFIKKACSELSVSEKEFREKIGDDLRWADPVPLGQSSQRKDVFGIDRSGEGYGQPLTHPLKINPTIEGIERYLWPDYNSLDIDPLIHTLQNFEQNYAIVGGPWSPFWHDAIDLVSLETLACQMYEDPIFVETLLTRIVDHYIGLATKIFEEAGDKIDLFFIRNDFGTQTGPMISPEHFYRFIKPCLIRFTALASRYNIKTMLHSSGGIFPLIPGIIESGFDALHALQPDCPGMQSTLLKKTYGGSIVLSGAIDARGVLLSSSPDRVKETVKKTLEDLVPGGGYIAAPSTDVITADVPVPNVLAMYEAINDFS